MKKTKNNMKKAVFLSILFLLFSAKAFCQITKEASVLELLKESLQEKIFVHFNSSLLFAGEYLYYKLYALNAETEEFSQISKIAYVELIGEDGKQVFQHKLQLENGMAQADFFIPTSVPSGNYKLVAYTQWMKNGSGNHFFENDLVLINPYRGDQSALRNIKNKETDSISGNKKEKNIEENAIFGSSENENFEINLSKGTKYGTREAVTLSIKSSNTEFFAGNFSISVRKMENIDIPAQINSAAYIGNLQKHGESKNSKNGKVFLPELRGDLISGRLEAVQIGKNAKVFGEEIALSIPGKEFVFKIAGTDENGNFYFNIDGNYSGEMAFLQVLGENKDSFKIILDETPKIDPENLIFNKFVLTPEMKDLIIRRSVYNQIENAFFSVKPDTLVTPEANSPFYGGKPLFFDLDEYTRFRTLKETFVEIVKFAGIRKTGNGEQIIEVRGPEGSTNHQLPSLLIVDGMLLQDHSSFIAYPAGKVQRIGIIRENYYYGPMIYSGIVIVETINGNYGESLQEDYVKEINLMKPQPKKEYFQQKYTDSTFQNLSRIPDFRNQLLWLPSQEITSEGKTIEFFTSDVLGKYEISIEGFSREGKAFSARKIISVEK